MKFFKKFKNLKILQKLKKSLKIWKIRQKLKNSLNIFFYPVFKGYLNILGRGKDLIISGGLNVYPKQVEDALDSLEVIKESAVIGIPIIWNIVTYRGRGVRPLKSEKWKKIC